MRGALRHLLLGLAAARPRSLYLRGGAAWSPEEQRYSRQLLAFGRDAHARLSKARVLVVGADAVGAEVCKNLALLGVAAVDVSDDGADAAGAHLYAARPEATCAERTVRGARELSATRVKRVEKVEMEYECVVKCGGSVDRAAALADACRAQKVPFVWCRCSGSAFVIFNDFGDGAEVVSRVLEGGAAETVPLEALTEVEGGYAVRTTGNQRHEACEGDFLDLEGAVLEVKKVRTPSLLEATLVEGEIWERRYGATLRPATTVLRQTTLRDALRQDRFAACDGSTVGKNALEAILEDAMPPDAAAAATCAGVAAHDVLKAVSGGRLGGPIGGQVLVDPGAPLIVVPPGAHVLVVGAGATGCELLKNLGLLGVAKVTVCDDDAIAPSNLSRQFLYRDGDVGRNKAQTAATAAHLLAPATTFVAVPKRLDAETEGVVDWNTVDVVISAVDSVPARIYLSRACVQRGLPMVDCGTLGASASVQPMVPFATESWHAQADAEDDERGGVPVCTIKDHPYKAEHCVWWSRDGFEGLFVKRMERLRAVMAASARPGGLRRWCRRHPQHVEEAVVDVASLLSDDAAQWAERVHHEMFVASVTRLLAAHPLDEVDEDGVRYWTGTRVPPAVPPTDAAFLDITAKLRRRVLGKSAAKAVPHLRDPVATLEAWTARLGPVPDLAIGAFDKDDPEHATWLAAAANLRAESFGIPPVDRLRAAQIAGRVVPAVATATAVASGLCALEAAKILGGRAKRVDLRSTFCGLAAPLWNQAPPAKPAQWRLPSGAVSSEWAPPTVRCALTDSVAAVAAQVAVLLCPEEDIETLVAPDGALVFMRALHARRPPALGDVLGGAGVVELQATSGDLVLPAVRLAVGEP
jgi:molybdopterin/thiamine biosynthesis adenylyltransferase